jgi:hypothetical protein
MFGATRPIHAVEDQLLEGFDLTAAPACQVPFGGNFFGFLFVSKKVESTGHRV